MRSTTDNTTRSKIGQYTINQGEQRKNSALIFGISLTIYIMKEPEGMSSNKHILSKKELSKYFRENRGKAICNDTINIMIRQGLPHKMIGKRVFFVLSEIEKWLISKDGR